MNEEKGIIHVRIQESPCDASDFGQYLTTLSNKMGNMPFALFMDNASIHKSKDVKPKYV